jgi:hypothetical protein
VKAKADDLLVQESHPLHKQKIHKIHTAMDAVVNGTEKYYTTKCMQFQVRLNRAWQAATTWSDADHLKSIEQLEGEIHQVTPAKHKYFDELLKRHEWQLLPEVGTNWTGRTPNFTQDLALLNDAADDEAYGAGNTSAHKRLQFQIRPSDVETEVTTWSLADTERVTNKLERETYGITSIEWNGLKKDFSIRLSKFEAWWETISIQVRQKSIEHCVMHFR